MRVLAILLIAALPAAHAAEPAAEDALSAPAAASGMPAPVQSAPAAMPAHAIPSAAAQPDAPASAPGAAAPRKAARRPAHARRLATKHAPGAASAARETAADGEQARNPVIDAIALVARTQAAEIKAADRKVANADWWLDTLDREWIVKRPFGPGLFDSTHWFYVSYKVNGRVLMSWFVDLAKGKVSPTTPPDRLDVQK